MARVHNIFDSDGHFIIDPITRVIKDDSTEKKTIVQFDHNSERFTFELPKIIEGHDMETSNRVEIHFLNIGSPQDTNAGIYVVDDMQLNSDDKNVLVLSWLISDEATQLAGSLNFLIRFACITDTGKVEYAWHTAPYTNIAITPGINNGEYIEREYPDVIAQWEARVSGLEKDLKSYIKTINGEGPDKNGNVNIEIPKATLPIPVKFNYSRIPHELSPNEYDMAYGNGRFVILGGGSDEYVALITTDFVNWERVVLPVYIGRIKFRNGKFIAVGGRTNSGESPSGNTVWHSEDGKNWTECTLPVGAVWNDIDYGDGYYVLVSGRSDDASDVSLYSTDLANWHQFTMPYADNWKAVCYGNGKFVAVTWTGSHVATFYPNGSGEKRWTQAGFLGNAYYYNIYFNNGKFYIPISKIWGESTNEIRVGDVLEFEIKTLPIAAQWETVAFGAGYTVLFAHSSDGLTTISDACYSTDEGETWEHFIMPIRSLRIASDYGRGMFACLGNNGVEFCYLSDNY